MSNKQVPWIMLFSRIALFVGLQSLFALGFFLAGIPNAWQKSADWWLASVAVADLVCLALLIRLYHAEGRRFRNIFRIDRASVKKDLLILLGATVLMAPVSYLPNVGLGELVFGDSAATLDLIVRPLPLWALLSLAIIFPIMQALTELPTYFGYSMPRLEQQNGKQWAAVLFPALMLSFQHLAEPLLIDCRYLLWRGLMFLPFALLVGIILHRKPGMMPYLALVHVLMDLSFVMMFFNRAY